MKGIYLDYAAHTPISKNSRKAIERVLKSESGNNQSVHTRGKTVRDQIQRHITDIKGCVHATHEHRVHVAGGGTATNREVLSACSEKSARKVFAYSAIEHSSIIEIANDMKEQGWSIVELPVTSGGVLDIDASLDICKMGEVGLVSLMMVNNEIGTVQPVAQFFKKLREKIPDVITHTDASQAPLFVTIDMQRLGVDALTLCGQKIYGPQGIGLSVVSKDISHNMPSSGTLPHALIAGFSVALKDAVDNREEYIHNLSVLKDLLFQKLNKSGVTYEVNGNDPLPLAISLTFPEIPYDSEYLVSYLNTKNIYLSSRSACLGSSEKDSYVLDNIGAALHNALRISLGNKTTKKDISILVDVLSEIQSN